MDVKTLCLGVLSLGDASGYEIKKAFEEGPMAHIHATSFGSIYPALGSLVELGQAKVTRVQQDKRPDKLVYAITKKGRTELHRSLKCEPGPDRLRSDFLFGLFFAHELEPSDLAKRLKDRKQWYRETLARMAQCKDSGSSMPAGPNFARGLGEAIYSAALTYLEENGDDLLEEILQPSKMIAE